MDSRAGEVEFRAAGCAGVFRGGGCDGGVWVEEAAPVAEDVGLEV